MTDEELNDIALEAIDEENQDDIAATSSGVAAKVAAKKKIAVVNTFIKQSKLTEDLAFSEHNLNDAMMNQASLFSYYASTSAKAQLQCDRLKTKLDYINATIDVELREEAAATGTKVTETLLSNKIKLDPRYVKSIAHYNESKAIAAMLKSTTEAFQQRRDMLVQIGKDAREDRLGELRIKANSERMDGIKQTVKAAVAKS